LNLILLTRATLGQRKGLFGDDGSSDAFTALRLALLPGVPPSGAESAADDPAGCDIFKENYFLNVVAKLRAGPLKLIFRSRVPKSIFSARSPSKQVGHVFKRIRMVFCIELACGMVKTIVYPIQSKH